MSLDFFDHVYAINLNRRPDRWESFMNEMKGVCPEERVERISACDPGDPQLGCALSHIEALKAAVEAKAKRPVIFEDDARFFDGWDLCLSSSIASLPNDWSVLYLGYNLDPFGSTLAPPEFVSENVLLLESALTTVAYCVNGNILETFIRDVSEIRTQGAPIDVIYSSLSLKYRLYGVYPMVVYQADGYSDIQKGLVKYTPRENVEYVLRSSGKNPRDRLKP